MVFQSVERLIVPQDIQFRQAILIAVVGLAVNLLCAYWLAGHAPSGHDHDHDHDHAHGHGHAEDMNVRLLIPTCSLTPAPRCWQSSRCSGAGFSVSRGWIR
jgi:Co/Zn/Cd efflux system component